MLEVRAVQQGLRHMFGECYSSYFLVLALFDDAFVEFGELGVFGVVEWIDLTISSSRFRVRVEDNIFGIASKNLMVADIILLIPTLDVSNLILEVEIEEIESIQNQTLFDQQIQRSLCAETWTVVHLQQQRLSVLFHQNIEA